MIMKKFTYLLLLCSTAYLVSCNEDSLSSDISPEKNITQNEHFCLDAYLSDEIIQKQDSTHDVSVNGVSSKYKKWNVGQTIKIKFLNGNSFLQDKVKQFASEWLKYANLNFEYVASNQDADIKINFDNSGGSWSYVGTDSKYIAQNTPSMNFGWFTNYTSDTEFSRTIIHEFGHALGLHHEHQSPTANIQWNKEKVYEYYGGAPNYWSKETVNHSIFEKYSSTTTNYSSFDSQSIMLYSFPASLTLDGWSSGWNVVLSPMDKRFISEQYPGKISYVETKNFYRYYINGQHFYTSNYNELGNRFYEGILGKIFANQTDEAYPIFRYYNYKNGDRLSTLNWNELKNGGQGGWIYEGISGYAYKTQKPNTIPVYRFFKALNKPDHFFTTNYSEIKFPLGNLYTYKYEGIAFYILK
ncbi:MAG: hypothetical protein J6581_06545 [Apibacter sp.]|nr:hypothetical protein [Apibacter sp.]